ncbi:MAG: M50 family metallopeptidase [Fimbriimonadaceae bacterium]|nr:site-2 protease family protein [Chthonomonadaceae bacterium]MCO5298233.1 M50 family metallopeptidase [Fimbriimonadaceae bacterium]
MLIVLTAVTFLVMISLLVAAHEYGHFLFARLCGMGVEEFSIGFGKGKWVYKVKDGTEFTVRPLPLGGFVRIKGMVPEEDGSEVDIPGGFYSKPPAQRLLVLFAGPLFSILAGVLILIGLFLSVPRHPLNEPVLGMVLEGKPAAQAGLQEGDRILSVDGQPVTTWYQLVSSVRDKPDQKLAFVVDRAGKRFETSVKTYVNDKETPVLGPDLEPTNERKKQAMIGAAPSARRSTVPEAVGEAVVFPFEMAGGMVHAFTSTKRFKEEIGGPISIVTATSEQVQRGVADVILLAGLLSISLGIFNLLPIPGFLDGGQMVVAFMELLRGGRRLSMRTQSYLSGLGFTILVVLIVSVFAVDIGRLGGR